MGAQREPIGMTRAPRRPRSPEGRRATRTPAAGAKTWTREVENAYRFQCAGWRSMEEYETSVRAPPPPTPRGAPPPLARPPEDHPRRARRRTEPADGRATRAHPPPPPQNYEMDTWEDLGLVQKLQTKSNGYFMYFKRDRECLDKYLPRVKLFEYAEEKDHK